MIKMICDRCGKEIKGTTYYTIDIYTEDINPKSGYTCCFDTAAQNTATYTRLIFDAKNSYCKDCKEEVEDFIKSK